MFWALIVGVFASAPGQASEVTGVRQTDQRCAKCHAEIYRKYLDTPMANASGAATRNLHATTYLHQKSGVEYTISTQHDTAMLGYREPGKPDVHGEQRLSYFLGSGHLGTTYLYSIGDYLFESPIAWYAASQNYDMKPGLEDMRQMPPPLTMQSSCMRCHMSDVQASDAGSMNRYNSVPFLHSGITCEACHGDADRHVKDGGKAGAVNPSKLAAEQRDSVCISCHLEGDVSVERAGHSALNYKPGESISTYVAYFVRSNAELTSRGVSEVEQLNQSTCKRMSGDKMSCISCHDPHFTPSAPERTSFYRSKCLACHNDAGFAKSHHPENPDCTSCHMPQNGAKNIVHVAWTDHRILRVPEAAASTAGKSGGDVLTPIFSPGANKRDTAMAYYLAFLEGAPSFASKAWDGLTSERSAINDDKEALDALGNMSAGRGESEVAEQSFRRVLEIDPHDLTALSNLGILLARKGKTNDALQLLRTAFERNQDISGLAMNLARVECMNGDAAAAQNTLKTALQYSPHLAEMQKLLTETSDCRAENQGASR